VVAFLQALTILPPIVLGHTLFIYECPDARLFAFLEFASIFGSIGPSELAEPFLHTTTEVTNVLSSIG
jgi:hypothetical protein